MPRKCCTVYNGDKCTGNYDKTKNRICEKVTVYGFPSDKEEQKRWVKSLTNVLAVEVTKNIGICEKHFPPDCPKRVAPGGRSVPLVPPSNFGGNE